MSKAPPKGKDAKGKQYWKASGLIKDTIPPYCKNPPRDPRPFKPADQIPPIQKSHDFEPLPDPEDWPGDDNVKLDATDTNPFKDNFDWTQVLGDQFYVLRRPKEYLRKAYDIEGHSEAPLFKKYNQQNEYEGLFFKEDTYSTNLETSEKILFTAKQLDQQICICESFEREETQEESERRKKEQLEKILAQMAKDKKKNTKKPEELVEEGPLKVRDVRLSDVQVETRLHPDSRWIGSQLQVIKDRDVRDVNTGKALWSKIYPQQDGAPVFNPDGRYWVKVYYMGKERKIEVDDRVPCSGNNPLLPQSSTPTQLWPIIISKAIFKLLQFQRMSHPNKRVIGDGIVMYSLMGLICETVSLKNISTQDWSVVNEMLSDLHYNRKDVFLTAFTAPDTKPTVASNGQKKRSREYINEVIKNPGKVTENFEPSEFNTGALRTEGESPSPSPSPKHFQQFQLQPDPVDEDFSSTLSVRPIDFTLEKFKRRRSVQILKLPDPEETNVVPGYAYSIVEQFQNRQFNMVYVQKRSDREMRLRTEYYEICKANIHKMDKQDKLDHRKRKKEIRERLNDEDKRRIELITQAAIQHRIIRVKTSNVGAAQPNVYCQFSAEEIYIAKKCITNKLSKPPNYDVPEIRGDDKSVVSQTVNKQNQDETFSVKPLDDFSALPNIQEPFRREGGGFWVGEKDFQSLFESIQLCYDPKKLQTSQIVNIPANPDNELATYENMEILIVQRNQEQEENSVVQLLLGFQAKFSANKDFDVAVRPYTVLQRFDLEQFETVKDQKVLNQYQSGQLILMDNKNNVFRISVFSPLQCTLWLSSTNNIHMCSIFEYLTEYESYTPKSIPIDYPAIQAKDYFLFFRFRIIAGEQAPEATSFVFRVKSTTDQNMLRSMRLKLCEQPADSKYMLQTIEGVHRNLYETVYMVQGTQRLQIRKGIQYTLLLEGIAPYAIPEGTLEVDFLLNTQIQIDQLETIEPTKYTDKYIPTKYGIIFRERIFINETGFASFYLRLGEVAKQELQQVQDKKAPPAKGKGPELPEIVDTEMKEKRLFKLELFQNDSVVMYSCGFNQAILSNVPLRSTKEETNQYILQATFDLREWPEAREHSQQTELINWFLTIFGTDSLGVVRDTTKEDREKAIKKSWEDKEPGRAERSKKSRAKFMIQMKQTQGQALTEEEQALLNAPRISRKQKEEEAKQQLQQKGGKAAKKEDKKAAKGGKKEEVQEVVQVVPKELPKSYNHINHDIVEFLTHLEADRLTEQYASHAGLINVRSEEQKKEIYEAVKLAQEEALSIVSRNMQMREELKLYQKDLKDTYLNQYQSWRQQFKEGWEQFLQRREALKQQMSSKIKKEKDIIDICRQERPVIQPEDFEKLLQDAQDTIPNINPELIKVALKQLKNIRINVLGDKLSTAVTNFELDNLKSCIEIIEANSVEGIDPAVVEKAYDMIEEARNNPNWVAEKQAELKKMGKKGKK